VSTPVDNLFADPSGDFIWFAAMPVLHKTMEYLKNPEETNSPSQVNLKFVTCEKLDAASCRSLSVEIV